MQTSHSKGQTVGDVGEFGLIERLARLLPQDARVVEGIGDDCAVLQVGDRKLLMTCDASIEDVHFRRDTLSPEAVGWRAAASALSDIAAMGGQPHFVVATLACPPDTEVALLEGIYRGAANVASRCHATIVGGDVTRSPSGIVLDMAVLGEAVGARYLTRSGARAGDVVAVTGWPGCSAAGLRTLEQGTGADELIHAHAYPLPRVAEGQWLAAQEAARAMIDLSDGLAQDAGHLAESAKLGVDLSPTLLPRASALAKHAEALGVDPTALILTGGEEYELIVALDSDCADALVQRFQAQFDLPLTIVGRFTDAWAEVYVDGTPSDRLGYQHFAERPGPNPAWSARQQLRAEHDATKPQCGHCDEE
mgnify:CR=1 FL=1